MTMQEYTDRFEQTEKAFRYFYKFVRNGTCFFYSDAILAGCIEQGAENYHIFRYFVSGLTDKQKAHIKKRYPLANVFFKDDDSIFEANSAKKSAFEAYKRGESQETELAYIRQFIND